MIQEIDRLLNDYIAWLKDKTVLRQIDDWVEITTPYLDRHNDYVQIYAKKSNGGFIMTDDGYTIDDLEQSGCKLENRRRQDLLKMTLNGFGVQLHGKALEVHATRENFALRKHNLVQAVLAINDMFYLAAPMVANCSTRTSRLGSIYTKSVIRQMSNSPAKPGMIIDSTS